MLPRVKEVLNKLLDEFKNGTIPEAVHYSMFPRFNIPSNSWSLLNRLTMYFNNTEDARGYKQWLSVNRHVIKGKTAFDILVPTFEKKLSEDTSEEKIVLKGFCCGSVFRVEDTDGEVLDYQKLILPKFPLIERAKALGVSVKAIQGNDSYYGSYEPQNGLIILATPEEKTFFHELCHLADHKLKGEIKLKQDPLQEIIAELSAQALCRIVGKTLDKQFGNSYRYIENYAKELKITPYNAVLQVIKDVDAILSYLLVDKEASV
jgi:hypothetical protein